MLFFHGPTKLLEAALGRVQFGRTQPLSVPAAASVADRMRGAPAGRTAYLPLKSGAAS
jgi:hypothetical protein